MHGIRRTVLFACLAASLAAQESEPRVYDLRALLGSWPRVNGKSHRAMLELPVALPLAEVSADAEPGGSVFSYPSATIDENQLLKLVGMCCGSEEDAQIVGGRLHLREKATVHDQVRDLLGALTESVRPQLELELHFLAGDVTSSSAVLDAKAVAAFLAQHAPAASHRMRIVGDVPVRIRAAAQQAFNRDYDAEVSTKMVMYDPKLDAIFDGLDAGVLATVQADGRILVTFGIQESAIERPMKVLKLRGRNQAKLHQPRMHSRTLAGSGVIADGGALVLGAGSERYGVCVLRVKRAAPPRQIARAGRFEAVPLGDLDHPGPRFIGARLPSPPGREPEPIPEPDSPHGDAWFAALQQLGVEPDSFGWEVVANHVIVHRGEKARDGLRQKLRERAAARRTLQLRVRAGRVAAEDAKQYLRGIVDTDAFVAKITDLGSLAALPDRSLLLVRGTERKYVRDFDIEIAQSAAVANPIMGNGFSGVSLTGSLTPDKGGALFAGRFLLAKTEFETFDPGLLRARDIDLLHSVFVAHEFTAVRLRGDEWTVLLVQPTQEKDYAVLAVRLAKE